MVRDLLRDQFGAVYGATAMNVKGMTHEDSLALPGESGNCANWILSHLTYVQNAVMALLDDPPVWECGRLAGPRSEPIRTPEEALGWEELRDRFLGSRDRCLEAIGRLADDALADRVPHPLGGDTTRAGALGFLALHQAYHVGQLGIARRVAGLEGAIVGPAVGEPTR